MIKLMTDEGELFFILEPGNFTKLQMGDPLCLNLKELGLTDQIKIYWTPDVPAFAVDLVNEKAEKKCVTSAGLDRLIQKSLERAPCDRVAN